MIETAYFNPKNVEEAVELLNNYGSKAKIIAGGTDLMVKINRGESPPENLIYIGDANLSYIQEDEENLVIGAATTLDDLMKSQEVKRNAPILTAALKQMASVAVRNTGTLGGNLCNASPAADTAVPLLALKARVKLVAKRGERVVDCQDFFVGPGQTVLAADELLKEVMIPRQGNVEWAYRKLGRRLAHTLSVVSAGIVMQEEDGVRKNVRIVLGAVAPVPLLAVKAAALLEGKALNAEAIEAAAAAASEETQPIDDIRSSAWYRKRASKAMVKSLLNQIAGQGDD
jgi:aerobic carbon-monoxide dehydrogenase medium subunit